MRYHRFIKAIILLSILVFSGCSKEHETNIDTDNINQKSDAILFSLLGIENEIDLNANSKSSNKNTLQEESSNSNIVTSVKEIYDDSPQNKLNASKLITDKKNAAVVKVSQNVQYRLIVYETLSRKLIFNEIVINNSTPIAVPISRNLEYDWVAYSYNEQSNSGLTENPIILSGSNINTFKINTVGNKPFMLAKGSNIKIVDTSTDLVQKNISILFKQKTTRFRIKADITSFFTNNPYLVTGSKFEVPSHRLYKGVYNPLNGSEGEYESYSMINSVGNFNTENLLDVAPASTIYQTYQIPNPNVKIAFTNYFYTAKLDAFKDLKIKANIVWRYKPTSQTTMNDITTYASNSDSSTYFHYKITNTILEYGKSYEFTAKINPAQTVIVNGIEWALYNLAYSTSNGYYIRENHDYISGLSRDTQASSNNNGWGTNVSHTDEYFLDNKFLSTANRTDYFQPGYYHMNSPGTYDNTRDLCKQVTSTNGYKWRLPTSQEIQSVENNSTFVYNGWRNVYYKGSSNGLTNFLLNFFPYGELTRSNTTSTTWTPIRAGWNDVSNANNKFDAGHSVYMYRNSDGKYGKFILEQTQPRTTNNVSPKFELKEISPSQAATNAISIRCVRDI